MEYVNVNGNEAYHEVEEEEELDRLRSAAEADRIGTAGMRDYIRQLEGLLRDLAAAWGRGEEPDEETVMDAVEGVVTEWQRIDPESQG